MVLAPFSDAPFAEPPDRRRPPLAVSPTENLIQALRDFGTRDVETLPVEVVKGANRRLVDLLLRSDVMARYRQKMLSRR